MVKVLICSVFQSFGIAEGGQVEDMKNMAKASGQPIPEYTPPDGETMEQVCVYIRIGWEHDLFHFPLLLPHISFSKYRVYAWCMFV